jgi:hypothetical protein
MAGDWIPMRVWLRRDPRVIALADYLAGCRSFMNWLTDPVQRTCSKTAYEHVDTSVTLSVTIAGLLQVWGVAREQGYASGYDLVLDCAGLGSLDVLAEVPCFGEAMEKVGWAKETDDGRVVFPKFFRNNVPNEDLRRRRDAIRKQRQRQKGMGQQRDKPCDSERDMSQPCHAEIRSKGKERKEENTNTPSVGSRRKQRPTEDAGFLRFWDAYPRKVAKRAAADAWLKLNPNAELLERILAAVEKQRHSDQWTREGGRFIPNPATWLRGQRWEDDLMEAVHGRSQDLGPRPGRVEAPPGKYANVAIRIGPEGPDTQIPGPTPLAEGQAPGSGASGEPPRPGNS